MVIVAVEVPVYLPVVSANLYQPVPKSASYPADEDDETEESIIAHLYVTLVVSTLEPLHSSPFAVKVATSEFLNTFPKGVVTSKSTIPPPFTTLENEIVSG